MPHSFGVTGWYNRRNAGDESYKLAFPRVFPKHHFEFYDKLPKPTPEIAILGGGDVVCPANLKMLTGATRKHILSASISKPIEGLKDFSVIAVRDVASLSHAEASGVSAVYVPDFAFMMDYNFNNGKKLIQKHFEGFLRYERVVGVVINSYLPPVHQGSEREAISFQQFALQLSELCDNVCASFLFIPFATMPPHDDRVSNGWVSSKCKYWDKNVCIFEHLSVQDTLDIISACDCLISTRLHSSIFSCVTQTPFIDITHNHKNKWFLESVDLTSRSIPYQSLNYSDMLDKVNLMLADDGRLRSRLKEITIQQRSLIRDFSKHVTLE